MKFLVGCSVALGWLLVLHTPRTGRAAEEDLTLWKKHNCLKDEKIFQMDWSADGGGKVRIESSGFHLMDDTGITSRFQLADGGRCTTGLTAKNRNIMVKVCGETLEVRAV